MYHKHKGGRPAVSKEKIRFKTIGVRVNQKEWDMLNQKAQEMNMSPARFLRECALKKRLPLPPVPNSTARLMLILCVSETISISLRVP